MAPTTTPLPTHCSVCKSPLQEEIDQVRDDVLADAASSHSRRLRRGRCWVCHRLHKHAIEEASKLWDAAV